MAHLNAQNYQQLWSFRLTLYVGLLANLLRFIPLLSLHEPKTGSVNPLHWKEIWRGKDDLKTIGKFSFSFVVIGFGAGLTIPYFNLYFSEIFKTGSGQIGSFYAANAIIMGLATLLVPAIASRLGKVKAISAAQAASLPFLLILAGHPYLSLAVIAFWMRNALMNMCNPLISALNMELLPENKRASANAIAGIAWNLSWATSTFFAGDLIVRYGYSPSFLITFGCYAISATAFYWFFRGVERK